MYKIAVLGDRDSVLGFRALGLDVFPVDGAEQARPVLRRLTGEGYAILYLTEQLAEGLADELERGQDALTPAIILIPGKEGTLGLGMNNIKTAVEQAVGADIL